MYNAKKINKKNAHHTAFYVDHAHINIFLKLLMQDWITIRGHEPLISFFKFVRSHSSLNAKIHTLNDIKIFLKKYHWEVNIILYNWYFYCKSKFTWHIWVKYQVFIAKFGQKVLPTFIESLIYRTKSVHWEYLGSLGDLVIALSTQVRPETFSPWELLYAMKY